MWTAWCRRVCIYELRRSTAAPIIIISTTTASKPAYTKYQGTKPALMLSTTWWYFFFFFFAQRYKSQPWVTYDVQQFRDKIQDYLLMLFYLNTSLPNRFLSCFFYPRWSCLKIYSITFRLSCRQRWPVAVYYLLHSHTDAVGYRVADRCLKHTLLVKLQPNSSRQLLSWLCEEAPACAARVAFPFVLRVSWGLRGLAATVPGIAGRWHNFLTFLGRMQEALCTEQRWKGVHFNGRRQSGKMFMK